MSGRYLWRIPGIYGLALLICDWRQAAFSQVQAMVIGQGKSAGEKTNLKITVTMFTQLLITKKGLTKQIVQSVVKSRQWRNCH